MFSSTKKKIFLLDIISQFRLRPNRFNSYFSLASQIQSKSQSLRLFSSQQHSQHTPQRPYDFNTDSEESLIQIFDSLESRESSLPSTFDIEYNQGVLTIKFDPKNIYVLNKQPPNQQIWLSSPFSGPRRFEWRNETENWCDVRDKTVELNEFLRNEFCAHLNVKL